MRVRNIGYVDVGWAGLMAVAALFIGLTAEGSPLARGLVAMFGSVWGARLCLHLLHRVLNEDEDGRYQALRAEWSGSPVRFFVFFQMQAVVVALFSIPFVAAASNPEDGFGVWMLAAVLVWLLSIGGEALADRQLAAFRADPGNRGAVVQMHEGSEPYFETPRLVESPGKSRGAAGPRTAERGNP